MSETKDPIGLYGKLNAGVLLAITPEYKTIGAAQRASGRGAKPTSASAQFSMQPAYRTVGGVKVRLAEGGKQDGPTVLLLSPLPQSILAFDPIWTRLSEHCRLVALDLPGFGRSEGGLEFMTFEAQGRVLADFVNELGLEQVHIVGPDVGMSAALHYVIHSQHRATSLLIGDGPGISPSHNGSVIDKMVQSGFWRMVFQIAGAGAFVEAGNRLCYVNYVPKPQEVADYVASYAGRIGPVTQWFAKYPDSLATVDPHLAEIDLPVKIFWGELDQLLFVDNGQRLHERMKRSELTVFPDCGHFSYQDKADEFAKMVLDWVGGGYRAV